MTLVIDLTPQQEERLSAFARSQGLEPTDLAKKWVTDHLSPGEIQGETTLSPEERIKAMDAFAIRNQGLPHLSDDAFNRENLYDERV